METAAKAPSAAYKMPPIDASLLLGARPVLDGERRRSAPQMETAKDAKDGLEHCQSLSLAIPSKSRGKSLGGSPENSILSMMKASWFSSWSSWYTTPRTSIGDDLFVFTVPCREIKVSIGYSTVAWKAVKYFDN